MLNVFHGFRILLNYVVVRVSIFACRRGNIEIFVQIETVRWWLIHWIKLSGLWATGPRGLGTSLRMVWFHCLQLHWSRATRALIAGVRAGRGHPARPAWTSASRYLVPRTAPPAHVQTKKSAPRQRITARTTNALRNAAPQICVIRARVGLGGCQ